MAEPETKYHFDYQEPENVTSKVPGEQRLRESVEASELAIAKKAFNDGNKIETPDDYTLTPVMTVTKNEEIRNGVFHTIKSPEYPEIHSDVLHEPQPIRGMGDQASEGDDKKRTRIPKLRFRQAASRVKRERRESSEKDNATTPYQRRSSIPKLQTKLPTQEPQTKHKDEEPAPLDDEFDKIYDEVVTSPVELDVSLLNAKVEDPGTVEHIFDEIIHAYDEENITAGDKTKQSRIPTFKRKSEHDIEVPKALLKTASDNKASADRVKDKDAINKHSDKESKPKLRKPTRIGVPKRKSFKSNDSGSREEVIETSFESPVELKDDVNFVDTFISPNGEENTPSNSLGIIDVTKIEDSDLIDNVSYSTIEVLEDKAPIYNETVELLPAAECVFEVKTAKDNKKATAEEIHYVTQNLFKESEYIVEYTVKEKSSVIPEFPIVDELNDHNSLRTDTIEVKEELVTEEISLEPKVINELPSDDDIPVIKGKVSRIIRRLGSREPKEENKVVVTKELPKTKSVLSRIAMFERPDPVAPKLRDNKISKLKPASTYKEVKSYETTKSTTPNIVSEVLKTTQNEIDLNPDRNSAYNRMPNEYNNNITTREIKTMSIEIVNIASNAAEIVINQNFVTENENVLEGTNNEIAPYVIDDVYDNVIDYTEERELQPADEYEIEYTQPINTIEVVPIDFEPNRDRIRSLNSNEDFVYGNYDTKKQRVETNDNYKFNNNDDLQSYKMLPKVETVEDYKTRQEENYSKIDPKDDVVKSYTNRQDYGEVQSYKIEPKVDVNKGYKIRQVETFDNVKSYKNGPQAAVKSFKYKQEETSDNVNSDKNAPKVEAIKGYKTRQVKTSDNVNSYKIKPKEETIKGYKIQQETHDNVKSYKNELKADAVKAYKGRKEEIEIPSIDVRLRRLTSINDDANLKKAKSTAELDLGDAVRGKVHAIIVRMNSSEKLNAEKREVINAKERPRGKSVLEKIALFEGKLSIANSSAGTRVSKPSEPAKSMNEMPDEELSAKVAELESARLKYGHTQDGKRITLADGVEMPMLAVGTALLDPKLTVHVVCAAIDLGYRAIDTAYIYGNEKLVGEAIKKKIDDGTVRREDLFIISKLWSTFHRTDLAEEACRKSLETMGLEYFDLYLIHNPMSFKEGSDPLPKIANVLQYSAHDYLDAWYGVESAVRRGLARSAGLSNFNANQLQRVVEKARVKPTVNQVECHPFLSQQKLDDFCQERGIKLACFGVLGSKGTPAEYKGFNNPVIDEPLVQVMASGLNITPAQLLIRYQLDQGRAVIVKASSAARLHENLQALNCSLTDSQVDALSALNKNKRTFTFKGMGDTHKNYPFRAPF